MADRAGQASVWPVSSDTGLRPSYGLPPFVRVATVDGSSLIRLRNQGMAFPPFTHAHRPLRQTLLHFDRGGSLHD